MTWSDRVPRRLISGWPAAVVDLMAVMAPQLAAVEINYFARRSEGAITITGTAQDLTTSAVVSLGSDPHRISVDWRGKSMHVEISPVAADTEDV